MDYQESGTNIYCFFTDWTDRHLSALSTLSYYTIFSTFVFFHFLFHNFPPVMKLIKPSNHTMRKCPKFDKYQMNKNIKKQKLNKPPATPTQIHSFNHEETKRTICKWKIICLSIMGDSRCIAITVLSPFTLSLSKHAHTPLPLK